MNSLLFSYIDCLSAMVAASAGAVSITPDYVGCGESVGHNRTFVSQIPCEQAISLACGWAPKSMSMTNWIPVPFWKTRRQ
jgi:hypothetical protein